mmetsp:Transcript_14912/g.22570  ORF Transcript_14912/g.22570 Transcript_14912/m.22570 type:complete len:91 (+) Transcript_14912:124-396(+)
MDGNLKMVHHMSAAIVESTGSREAILSHTKGRTQARNLSFVKPVVVASPRGQISNGTSGLCMTPMSGPDRQGVAKLKNLHIGNGTMYEKQ